MTREGARIREDPASFMPRGWSGSEIYRLSKMIDGYPGDGTFGIAAKRAFMHSARRIRQVFYEPISSYDTLLEVIQQNWRLHEAGVPQRFHYFPQIVVRLFESVYEAPHGDLQLPQAGEREHGQHALSDFSGWSENGERLYFANTWGEEWGDSGRGSVSRRYVDRFMTDAWVTRSARVGPSRFIWPRLTSANSEKAFADAWLIPNPISVTRFRHRGFGHRMTYHETDSVCSRGYVSIIEIQNGNGLRLAWAFLFHTREANRPISILKEFYVWPDFRRRGYGSILESAAVDVARQVGSSIIQCFFHQIDGWPHIRAVGENFARDKGYSLVTGTYEFPSLYVVTEKSL